MLEITVNARGHLASVLESSSEAPDWKAFRIVFVGDDLTITLDDEKPGDRLIEYNGQPVALLDEESDARLANQVLDFGDTTEGPALWLASAVSAGI